MPPRRNEADSSSLRTPVSLLEPRTEPIVEEGERDIEVRIAAPPESRGSLERLRNTAARCKACPLWRYATQTVFGEGKRSAPLFIVGEQPGHNEDLEGHPFVGPAGQLLERAFAAAQLEREDVYVTNAVKHFKWELRGKRRLHKTPAQKELDACHPWLEAELDLVEPKAVLCLGATAARAVLGAPVRIGEHRGQRIETPNGLQVVITVHPAYILRLKGGAAQEAYDFMARDLAYAASLAGLRRTTHA